jgi:dTDP-4-amino-4,6-dideoxygalactose transaminase
MGEGGALLVNKLAHADDTEIIREKGTDRAKFFRGEVDKYSWVQAGSSYLPSELNAAYLWPQLEQAEEINAARMACWEAYYQMLSPLANRIKLPHIPPECGHNAHMFYIKCGSLDERTSLIAHLRASDIYAVFHYVPLHSAPAGLRYGRFCGEDVYTTADSDRLLRLPMYYGLTIPEVEYVCSKITEFYQ